MVLSHIYSSQLDNFLCPALSCLDWQVRDNNQTTPNKRGRLQTDQKNSALLQWMRNTKQNGTSKCDWGFLGDHWVKDLNSKWCHLMTVWAVYFQRVVRSAWWKGEVYGRESNKKESIWMGEASVFSLLDIDWIQRKIETQKRNLKTETFLSPLPTLCSLSPIGSDYQSAAFQKIINLLLVFGKNIVLFS